VGAESKYLGYMRRAPDSTVTNLEQEPLGVLVATITDVDPTAPAAQAANPQSAIGG
jgi:hypothetical protein